MSQKPSRFEPSAEDFRSFLKLPDEISFIVFLGNDRRGYFVYQQDLPVTSLQKGASRLQQFGIGKVSVQSEKIKFECYPIPTLFDLSLNSNNSYGVNVAFETQESILLCVNGRDSTNMLDRDLFLFQFNFLDHSWSGLKQTPSTLTSVNFKNADKPLVATPMIQSISMPTETQKSAFGHGDLIIWMEKDGIHEVRLSA